MNVPTPQVAEDIVEQVQRTREQFVGIFMPQVVEECFGQELLSGRTAEIEVWLKASCHSSRRKELRDAEMTRLERVACRAKAIDH